MKIFFYTRKFLPTSYSLTIKMNSPSFLDCKHKHMIKNRAPPDKVGVLHRLLPIEFNGFTRRNDHCSVPGITSFLEKVWVPLNKGLGLIEVFRHISGMTSFVEKEVINHM